MTTTDVAGGLNAGGAAGAVAPRQAAAPLPRKIRRMLSLADFEAAAQKHLPRSVFGFVSGAVEDNNSRADNRAAFADYGFVPRILVDVSTRSQATTLFGETWSAPFGIAPMGASALAAYRGDLVLARAAAEADIPMIMSGSSLIRLEEIAQAAPRSWFQAYLPGEPQRILGLVERVAMAGFGTLLLTVDVAVLANRENNVRNGYSTPLRPTPQVIWDGLTHPDWLINTLGRTIIRHGMPHFENSFAGRGAPIIARNVMREFGMRDHLNWEHLELIRKNWKGRLVVKGIMRQEDAHIARESGADGVIVSNHGGRQLDGAVSPLRVLSGIAAEARGMTIMYDGGIRRGTDILKALALGANFVFVGRPFLYAASVGGEAGVRHAADLLKLEVQRDMALLGINTLAEMKPDLLMKLR